MAYVKMIYFFLEVLKKTGKVVSGGPHIGAHNRLTHVNLLHQLRPPAVAALTPHDDMLAGDSICFNHSMAFYHRALN
jgi:hypothetical protein